jgi:hypothetical protein
MARYIVLGLRSDAEDWRQSHGLKRRDVIYVSTRNARALRGLTGRFEVITLPSWHQASAQVRREIERDLAIIAATTRHPA